MQYFIDIKNDRKGDSLEGSIYPIVLDAVRLGEDHISLDADTGKRLKSLSATKLWGKITNDLEGDFKRNNDGNIIEPNTFYSADFGRLYRSRVIAIIRDKFGAEKDHKESGNNLIFDLDRLEQMNKIYENDGKITISPNGESANESAKNERENDKTDSLTHPDHASERGHTSESGNKSKTDSQCTIDARGDQSASVRQVERKNPDSSKIKCPYCDYEDHPFFMKLHRQNCQEQGQKEREYKNDGKKQT